MILIICLNEITFTANGCIIVGFYNRVSDPAMGASYLTSLISISNLGVQTVGWFTIRLAKWIDY